MAKIGSVDKCLRVLDELGREPAGIGVRELARRLDVYPSGVHAILTTMEAQGFLRQDEQTKKFKLGVKILRLANQSQLRTALAEVSMPQLRHLVDQVGETAVLAGWEAGAIVQIATVTTPNILRVDERQWSGDTHYATAYGKLLLSTLDNDAFTHYLHDHPLLPLTDRTITDIPTLQAELLKARQQGYAETEDEAIIGVSAIAVPITGHAGKTIAVVGVSAPTIRFNAQARQLALPQLRQTADLIAHKLT